MSLDSRRMRSHIFILALTALALAVFPGCPRRSTPQPAPDATEQSVVDSEQDVAEAFDWSTVTAEDLWPGVFDLYESEGPRMALAFLDGALEARIVDTEEANQVRAGFLYELGRLDDAFLALLGYTIDANRPDLLRLRAEITWNMGRYEEAKAHYEMLLETDPENPAAMAALARLYDDLCDWASAETMRDRLRATAPEDPSTLQVSFYRAILSEEIDRITAFSEAWTAVSPYEEADDPILTLAHLYEANLGGDSGQAAEIARAYNPPEGFNINVAIALLRLDAENGDFEGLENDLRDFIEKLGALEWLDAPEGSWPAIADKSLETATLLGWASSLELGRGNVARAKLLAERAGKYLNPYDLGVLLQLAAIALTEGDMETSVEYLNEAATIAPPSDVRTKLRMLQYSPLVSPETEAPWDSSEVASELESILSHRLAEFPNSAFIRAAQAELQGCRGDLQAALATIEESCALPGATREMHLRRAYYLARLGGMDDAWSVVEEHLPPGCPYLMWANMLAMEALALSDPNLADLALRVRDRVSGDE